MILNDNKKSWFIASSNNYIRNSEYWGLYKADLIEADFKELCDLLNYIDFKNIPTYGTAGGHPAEGIKIIYDNGKVKEIYTYELSQTYGLMAIFHKMEQLRLTQNWNKSSKTVKVSLPEPERRVRWKA